MPAATSEPPSVSLSFANNFWGKDDAGVSPLLERMHNAKVTCDELKSFYTARAAIEDEYSRKLLNLSRKPLGSSEAGTLRMSLDVIRTEVESMGKAHQNIAAQMKSELEEPLAAFAGGMKERRKIVQNGIEKLLKLKTQQTTAVNKARDRYEQDCLKIKGYLAQGHMVMGQEERKNKAKLEKTQIQLSTTSSEYEAAVKMVEETTGRWNRDWKAGCDKFQDLEEERIDFLKSSLWTFANIASTVCVSDDASCEKIRLSLEDCDVEKDIYSFIRESGTGQEIPDPPKFINFCRGDLNDNASDTSDEGNYSVAQFQRTMNPAFRTSSPQPSVFESHHDPNHPLAKEFGHKEHSPQPMSKEPSPAPQTQPTQSTQPIQSKQSAPPVSYSGQTPIDLSQVQFNDIPKVPHNEYPMDGMTQFCRIGPPSERSSVVSPVRPPSGDSQSEYSNPTSFSSMEPPSGTISPVKQMNGSAVSGSGDEKSIQKKKSGFFQSHSPFRRRSKHDKDASAISPANRNTWGPSTARNMNNGSSTQTRPTQNGTQRSYGQGSILGNGRTSSPEPIDPRANFQLNIGNNVFDVASPDIQKASRKDPATQEELDPIAQALAELKGVTKQASTKQPSTRQSADRYHGIATPIPPATPGVSTPVGGIPTSLGNSTISAAQRGTPPPSYEQPVSRLGAPKPAFTARQMQQTTQKYIDQKTNMFNTPVRVPYESRNSPSRPATRANSGGQEIIRTASPAPLRSVSPRPALYGSDSHGQQQQQQQPSRAKSPNPYSAASNNRPRAQSSSPIKPRDYGSYGSRGGSPGQIPKDLSPQLQFTRPPQQQQTRAPSPQPQSTKPAQQQPRASSPQPQLTRPVQQQPRAISPQPHFTRPAQQQPRTVSPQPQFTRSVQQQPRAASPQPQYARQSQQQARSVSPQPQYTRQPQQQPRAVSPQPQFTRQPQQPISRAVSPAPQFRQQERPSSSRGSDMALQLAPAPSEGSVYGGSQRGGSSAGQRPLSYYGSSSGGGSGDPGWSGGGQVSRMRSKSVAEPRQYTKDGRPILHYSRAMYMYQAAIPEELSFAKGDILAVLRLQDDGWWEAEVVGKNGRPGLVPSNYLQNC
ncbi:hypothetical protein M501DRAFT_985233 [Patellaria atrata CBS 101060]|uniref:SH3 domain-containing protein n=1 Tax=Patellaria atrata CBS 101060 TaxID=1346257 RepID=A0A9P4VWU5_9PEZI|nr:hypothetical protein M501DRAFT_985233 [Patellaria atrata CBS 101060]